jgi:hypothetical protein
VKAPKRFVSPSTSIIGSDIEINQENRKVDRLAAASRSIGPLITRWGVAAARVPPFLCSCFPDSLI